MSAQTVSTPPNFNLRAKLGKSGRPLISLTPLIDVVFILLIFFMLATSFLDWRVITLNMPPGLSSGASEEGSLLVRIQANGELDLNGEVLSEAILEEHIADLLKRRPEVKILIQPANGVPLQRSVSLIDRLNRVGGSDIRFLRVRE